MSTSVSAGMPQLKHECTLQCIFNHAKHATNHTKQKIAWE